MPISNDNLNKKIYRLLKVQGYNPIPKDSKGNTTPVPDEADVFKFDFKVDGNTLGPAWITIDSNKDLKVYYDDKVMGKLSEKEDLDKIDDFTEFLEQLKMWAQRKQLGFDTVNQDHLASDMAQREYMKKKEKISEGYYPMGKTSSYNDSVPTVKIILQHTRQIQEGEQRYRNIARIFLENTQGERILAPTVKPGIAQVYARHLAEGGVPNDERWNHIKSLCEEYGKMAGFVRAVRGNQFNESAQRLVEAGLNHYTNLRETLGKMRGHRGYNAYFESWTPTLMENEGDDNTLNELFVQETLDPRIESVMPILNKLSKNLGEMKQVKELEEWAESLAEAPGAETLAHNKATEKSRLNALDLDEDEIDDAEAAKKKMNVPAYQRKAQGGDWKVTQQDLDKLPAGTRTTSQGLAAHAKRIGLEEESDPKVLAKKLARQNPNDVVGNFGKGGEELGIFKSSPDPKVLAKKLARQNPNDVVGNFGKGGEELGIFNEEEVEESALQAFLGRKKYGADGMKELQRLGRNHASKEKIAKAKAQFAKEDLEGVAEGFEQGASYKEVRGNFNPSSPDAKATIYEILRDWGFSNPEKLNIRIGEEPITKFQDLINLGMPAIKARQQREEVLRQQGKPIKDNTVEILMNRAISKPIFVYKREDEDHFRSIQSRDLVHQGQAGSAAMYDLAGKNIVPVVVLDRSENIREGKKSDKKVSSRKDYGSADDRRGAITRASKKSGIERSDLEHMTLPELKKLAAKKSHKKEDVTEGTEDKFAVPDQVESLVKQHGLYNEKGYLDLFAKLTGKPLNRAEIDPALTYASELNRLLHSIRMRSEWRGTNPKQDQELIDLAKKWIALFDKAKNRFGTTHQQGMAEDQVKEAQTYGPDNPYQVEPGEDFSKVFEPGRRSGVHYYLNTGMVTDPFYFKLNNKLYSVSNKGDGLPREVGTNDRDLGQDVSMPSLIDDPGTDDPNLKLAKDYAKLMGYNPEDMGEIKELLMVMKSNPAFKQEVQTAVRNQDNSKKPFGNQGMAEGYFDEDVDIDKIVTKIEKEIYDKKLKGEDALYYLRVQLLDQALEWVGRHLRKNYEPYLEYVKNVKDAKEFLTVAFRDAQNKGMAEGSLNEMDSEGYKGSRDEYDLGKGPEGKGKPVKPEDAAKDAENVLNKAIDKAHQKDVKEGQEDLDAIIRIIKR